MSTFARKRIETLLLAVATLSLLGSASGQEFRSFDFPGAVNSQGTAVTPAGEIAGRYFSGDGSLHGFVLRRGQFSSIDFPGASSTDANWINARG